MEKISNLTMFKIALFTLLAVSCSAGDSATSKIDWNKLASSRAGHSSMQKLSFILYSRAYPHGQPLNNLSDLLQSHFDPNRETKILLDVNFKSLPRVNETELITAYLRHFPHRLNVIWATSETEYYCDSRDPGLVELNSRMVNLIRMLHEYGALLDRVHILGHGCNADLSKRLSEELKPYQVGRITGLDPLNELAELDNKCAIFVDTIYTNTKTKAHHHQGIVQFNPNGGEIQPSNSEAKETFVTPRGIVKDLSSHIKAYYYYVESIVRKMAFIGYRANSWDDYKTGDYNKESATSMGEYVPSESFANVYLNVNPEYPYGQGPLPEPLPEDRQ